MAMPDPEKGRHQYLKMMSLLPGVGAHLPMLKLCFSVGGTPEDCVGSKRRMCCTVMCWWSISRM